ncbi:hypothetical protein CsSME_00043472 [Camellia sinensis var. sinensis]
MAMTGDEGNVPRVRRLSTSDSMATSEEVARLEGMMEDVVGRLTRLEEVLVGPGKPTPHITNFFSYFASLVARVGELEEKVDSQQKALEARVASFELELELCKKAIVAGNGGNVAPARRRVRATKPKSYDGARGAQESHAKGGRQSPQTTEDERSDVEPPRRRERRKDGQRTGSPGKRHEGKGQLECYLCNGPHMVRNCPKKALRAEKKRQLSAMKRKGKKEARDSESEDPSEKMAQLGSIQLLGLISKENEELEEPRSIQKKDGERAEVKAKGRASHAQEEKGATLRFECTDKAERLGLKKKGLPECFLCDGPHMVKDCPERKKSLAGMQQSGLHGKDEGLAKMQQSGPHGKGEEASSSSGSGHRSYRDVLARYAFA